MSLKVIPDGYICDEETKKELGMSLKQKKSIEVYSKLQIKEQFLKLHYRALDLVIRIKDCFPLYFYMCDNVTRGKGRYSFWNDKVLPYYYQGYLPFAKHQIKIGEDLHLSQPTISNQLKILNDNDLIAKLGVVEYSDKKPMTVWAVGTWVEDDKARKEEIYFIQSISFMDK